MHNDFMLRLARNLFSMFILLILLSKSREFLMYELLIVQKIEFILLTKDFATIWAKNF